MLVLMAAITCFIGASVSTALAAPGDSIPSAVLLNDYFGQTYQSVLATDTGGTGHYFFRTSLSAGQTLKASFESSEAVLNLKATVLPYSPSYGFTESVPNGDHKCSLSFMAPVTGIYNIWVPASTAGTFTVSSLVSTDAVNFGLSSFKSPSSAKRSHSFSVSVKMWPGYNGPVTPVRFYFDRKITSKRYKSYGYVWGTMSTFSTYSKFVATTKLKTKGTYRIRARFSDAAHSKSLYTAYHTIKIK